MRLLFFASVLFYPLVCMGQTRPSEHSQLQTIDSIFTSTPILKDDIHSLLVLKNGELEGEFYYNGFNKDSLNNVKSISKSIIGLLTGIAIKNKLIPSTSTFILPYFEECEPKSTLFEDKASIRIENLLQMQSGIEWNNRAPIKDEWWFNDSPHCFLLNEFPMNTAPGTQFSYNTAAAHLLSGLISRAAGISTEEFANTHLFEPLDIIHYYWEKDANGEVRGNSELYLTPQDLLKFGEMLLNGGIYHGLEIVPESWITMMLTKAYDATSLMDYGYLWMTSKNNQSPFFYFAGGSGGQHLFIIPDKNMVVVTTGHWNNARSTLEIMQVVVAELINNG